MVSNGGISHEDKTSVVFDKKFLDLRFENFLVVVVVSNVITASASGS